MGISFLLFQMNWSMKRKSSRPSQTSSTRPLPRCPVTKKNLYRKNLSSNIALKILTQSFTIPFPPAPRIFLANWVEFQARSARIIIPSVATHYPTKQTLQHTYFVFFLTFFVNKTSPEVETSCDVFVPSLYPCLF